MTRRGAAAMEGVRGRTLLNRCLTVFGAKWLVEGCTKAPPLSRIHPMRSQSAARFHVVKKDEKEARLTEFIRQFLAAASCGVTTAGSELLLVARSPRSPVVRALRALADERCRAGLGIRIVLLEAGNPAQPGLLPDALGGPVRLLCDLRALEAHEQLVLGPATVWIGDCMRREPDTRDAFEAYAEACPLTAGWARSSFLALWRRADPPEVELPDAPVAEPQAVVSESALPVASETPVGPTASTRH